jgi:hypothetical protein
MGRNVRGLATADRRLLKERLGSYETGLKLLSKVVLPDGRNSNQKRSSKIKELVDLGNLFRSN